MNVSIVIREGKDYRLHAQRVARELKRVRGIEAEIVAVARDVFDIRLDGDLIFSKSHTGRFPEPSELLPYVGQC